MFVKWLLDSVITLVLQLKLSKLLLDIYLHYYWNIMIYRHADIIPMGIVSIVLYVE